MNALKTFVPPFVAGLLFAIGLALGGLTDPTRVIGFLDVFGDWDATLMFVMAGAVAVNSVAYRIVRRRRAPWFAPRFQIPTRKDIDQDLVLGAAVFGVGWGLSGFCPGPGIVASISGGKTALLFVLMMAAGMLVAHWFTQTRSTSLEGTRARSQ